MEPIWLQDVSIMVPECIQFGSRMYPTWFRNVSVMVPQWLQRVSNTAPKLKKTKGDRLANRRMFSKDVVQTDDFMMMTIEAQNLFFHLGIIADDDGFTNNYKTTMRMIGVEQNALKELENQGLIYEFKESGVLVIRVFLLSNSIKRDRYTKTIFQDEFKQLTIKNNKYYLKNDDGKTSNFDNGTKMEPEWNQDGTKMETEWNQPGTTDKNRLDKNRLEEIRRDEDRKDDIRKEEESQATDFEKNKTEINEVDSSNKDKQIALAVKAWNSIEELKPLNDEEVKKIGDLINIRSYDEVIQVIANIANSKKLLSDNIRLRNISLSVFDEILNGKYN